jgi:hypothetical protein
MGCRAIDSDSDSNNNSGLLKIITAVASGIFETWLVFYRVCHLRFAFRRVWGNVECHK